ncbi:MAG: TraB/GumN family protein [Spirochaetaceae bacterium]|jgi:pheromone shutdown-related protein TraB|nr:TraB/GumN family protein [Spirochaetaceae bacterium]
MTENSGTSDTRIDLRLGGREIILVGTAHISRESIEEVREIILRERPDMVCVELDKGRFDSMTQQDSWAKLDIIKVIREGKGFLLIANLVLSGFQYRLGDDLGVKPGEEMRAAVDAAVEIGAPYSFCDREVHRTLRRAWSKCGLWNKCKLLAGLLSSAFSTEKLSEAEIENLKKQSELDGMMKELADYLPPVKETLIDERDRYLAARIWQNAAQDGGGKTVAVVGAGHLEGIRARIERIASGTEGYDVSELETVRKPGPGGKAASWIIPAVIVAIIAAGFFRAGAELSLDMLLRWMLWNGSLAAAGSLIALAHPLAILASFVGAPIATLSPVIGVGLFSGVAQAVMHRPRIEDAETLVESLCSVKGVYRNRITRVLLVFFLSSIGGMVGNFVSIPRLAGILMNA